MDIWVISGRELFCTLPCTLYTCNVQLHAQNVLLNLIVSVKNLLSHCYWPPTVTPSNELRNRHLDSCTWSILFYYLSEPIRPGIILLNFPTKLSYLSIFANLQCFTFSLISTLIYIFLTELECTNTRIPFFFLVSFAQSFAFLKC